jgi:hypothetical protein
MQNIMKSIRHPRRESTSVQLPQRNLEPRERPKQLLLGQLRFIRHKKSVGSARFAMRDAPCDAAMSFWYFLVEVKKISRDDIVLQSNQCQWVIREGNACLLYRASFCASLPGLMMVGNHHLEVEPALGLWGARSIPPDIRTTRLVFWLGEAVDHTNSAHLNREFKAFLYDGLTNACNAYGASRHMEIWKDPRVWQPSEASPKLTWTKAAKSIYNQYARQYIERVLKLPWSVAYEKRQDWPFALEGDPFKFLRRRSERCLGRSFPTWE